MVFIIPPRAKRTRAIGRRGGARAQGRNRCVGVLLPGDEVQQVQGSLHVLKRRLVLARRAEEEGDGRVRGGHQGVVLAECALVDDERLLLELDRLGRRSAQGWVRCASGQCIGAGGASVAWWCRAEERLASVNHISSQYRALIGST